MLESITLRLMWQRLTGFKAPAEGELAGVAVGGRPLVVAQWNGRLYALDDRCPHDASVSLSDAGWLSNGKIFCRLHGADVSVETGCSYNFPAIRTYPIDIRSDGIFLRLGNTENPA